MAATAVAVAVAGGAPGAHAADDAEGAARADDPDFLSFAAGWYNIGGSDDQAAEFRLEYRSDLELWILKPFAALAATTSGSVFVGAGLLADIDLGPRFVLTGSVAANYYARGSASFDLGHAFEIRSQAELAWRFDDRSRLGIAFSHYSNVGLGEHNPGAETLSLYYSLPLGLGE